MIRPLLVLIATLLIISGKAYQFQSPARPMWRLAQKPSLWSRTKHSSRSPMRMMSIADAQESSPEQSLATTILYKIGGSTSILVAGTFFIVLAYQRDALMVSFFMGAITNGALSKVLKKILNQDRPLDTDAAAAAVGTIEKPGDKGMPSSHAMSLGFIGTFTMITLEWTRLVIPLYVATALYYRVQTRLHTREQVAAGMLFGIANGYAWRHLVDGTNPWGISVMDFVTKWFLNEQGVLPAPLLLVPALAGAIVVGSLERRISKLLKTKDS